MFYSLSVGYILKAEKSMLFDFRKKDSILQGQQLFYYNEQLDITRVLNREAVIMYNILVLT